MKAEIMTWEGAYALLADTGAPSDPGTICAAITRLGKPLDLAQVNTAALLVSKYLRHENFLARYQAIWFLGCWGKIHEYLPLVVEAAQSDEEVDNRAFAARCAGQILKSHRDAYAIKALHHMATDEGEEPDVRLAAYSALLYAFYGAAGKSRAREFEPVGEKAVTDFDLPWLSSLPEWADGLPVGTR
jgi:hypothetical protein